MNYNERTVGGGPATGLANDFTAFLQNMITTGSFGGGTAGQQAGAANPYAGTQNIMSVLNNILSGPSNAAIGSMQDLIKEQQTSDVNSIRSRFGAQGAMAFGTPAAYAESMYRSQAAPQAALATNSMINQNNQMALSAILPFFGMASNLSALGIPQAQTTLQAPGWMQGLQLAGQIAAPIAGAIAGNPNAVASAGNIGQGAGPTPVGMSMQHWNQGAGGSGIGLGIQNWNQPAGGIGLGMNQWQQMMNLPSIYG